MMSGKTSPRHNLEAAGAAGGGGTMQWMWAGQGIQSRPEGLGMTNCWGPGECMEPPGSRSRMTTM